MTNPYSPIDYNKIKVGVKYLEDAVLDVGSLKGTTYNRVNKQDIMCALADQDVKQLRVISKYFFQTSGIYQKVCNYFATMYRYDWYVSATVYDKKAKQEEIVTEFNKVLNYLDNSHIKKICGDIATRVIVDGAYYGYVIMGDEGISIQDLPINYCRSRYSVSGKPAVEFNMRFFDEQFTDINYRMRVLKLFPKEFAKGYLLYKQGKLTADYVGDINGSWYLLDPEATIKFSLGNGDVPLFVNAVPAILDLDQAQELDRRKQMQKLLKIVVQKLPRDKNGDLIFDVDEARDLHNNAVAMLKRAVGVDVLTTFADIDAIDMSDKNTSTSKDDLEKVERAVFNAIGSSRNLFNTDGNLTLEKSVLNDEGQIRSLIYQYEMFFDKVAQFLSKKKKKYVFRLYMLNTTQYNYKDLSKTYKEQAQLGCSKMLSQVALGHSQSSILNTAYFENEILNLNEIMIPPLSSATMSSSDSLGKSGQSNSANSQNSIEEEKEAGRPEKPDDEKSEKTIQNIESMS